MQHEAWKQNSINVNAISCKFHQCDKPTTHITLVSLRSILHTCLVFFHPLNLYINVIQHTINTFILLIIDYCKTRSKTFCLTFLSVLRCCVCIHWHIMYGSWNEINYSNTFEMRRKQLRNIGKISSKFSLSLSGMCNGANFGTNVVPVWEKSIANQFVFLVSFLDHFWIFFFFNEVYTVQNRYLYRTAYCTERFPRLIVIFIDCEYLIVVGDWINAS